MCGGGGKRGDGRKIKSLQLQGLLPPSVPMHGPITFDLGMCVCK